MTDFEVDKLIVVTSAKKGAKGQQLDQQLINDGLALYQEQLSDVSCWCFACYADALANRCSKVCWKRFC
jgi:hypothetical protein